MSGQNKKEVPTPGKQNPNAGDGVVSNKKTGPEESIIAARENATSDIDKDPDFSPPTPNDDLDEGEIARLGEDKPDLI